MNYICQNETITIRVMEDCKEDYDLLTKWLSNPDVLQYYEGKSNLYDIGKVMKKFAPRAKGDELVFQCIIQYNCQAIGYIQYYQIDYGDYGITGENIVGKYLCPFGVDLFIGETDYWNKGLGTKLLSSLIKYLFEYKNADIVFIDPQTWNKRAIRCYEKVGFKAKDIIKNREFHDGEYKDSLIMYITPNQLNTGRRNE